MQTYLIFWVADHDILLYYTYSSWSVCINIFNANSYFWKEIILLHLFLFIGHLLTTISAKLFLLLTFDIFSFLNKKNRESQVIIVVVIIITKELFSLALLNSIFFNILILLAATCWALLIYLDIYLFKSLATSIITNMHKNTGFTILQTTLRELIFRLGYYVCV